MEAACKALEGKSPEEARTTITTNTTLVRQLREDERTELAAWLEREVGSLPITHPRQTAKTWAAFLARIRTPRVRSQAERARDQSTPQPTRPAQGNSVQEGRLHVLQRLDLGPSGEEEHREHPPPPPSDPPPSVVRSLEEIRQQLRELSRRQEEMDDVRVVAEGRAEKERHGNKRKRRSEGARQRKKHRRSDEGRDLPPNPLRALSEAVGANQHFPSNSDASDEELEEDHPPTQRPKVKALELLTDRKIELAKDTRIGAEFYHRVAQAHQSLSRYVRELDFKGSKMAQRDAATYARAIDLIVDQVGTVALEVLDGVEVISRRLISLIEGIHNQRPSLMDHFEELPSPSFLPRASLRAAYKEAQLDKWLRGLERERASAPPDPRRR